MRELFLPRDLKDPARGLEPRVVSHTSPHQEAKGKGRGSAREGEGSLLAGWKGRCRKPGDEAQSEGKDEDGSGSEENQLHRALQRKIS